VSVECVVMAEVASTPECELKRLSRVVAACESAASCAPAQRIAALYARTKQHAVLQPLVSKVEALATPYVSGFTSPKTVQSMDNKVDATIVSVQALYESRLAPAAGPLLAKASLAYGSVFAYGSALVAKAPKDTEQFVQLRDAWLVSMETVIAELKTHAATLPSATMALVQAKIEAVKSSVPADSKQAMESCAAAWEKFTAYPSVAKYIETASPHVVAAKELALKTFERVVESERYGKYVTPMVDKYMPSMLKDKFASAPSSPEAAIPSAPAVQTEQ
jgi:hypothetical protein